MKQFLLLILAVFSVQVGAYDEEAVESLKATKVCKSCNLIRADHEHFSP